jgi:hypothetical protein
VEDKKIDVVTLPELSAEQKQLLREQFQREEQVAASAAEEHVYTNPTTERQFIPDLGIKAGDVFMAESFAPGETKDLAQRYRLREIRASKFLPMLVNEQKKLLRGRVAVDVTSRDPFHEMAVLRPDGSFNDPMSGKRPYDLKLRDLEDKEEREERDTRITKR